VAKVLGGRTAKPVIASPAIRHTGNELNRGPPSMANLFPESILAALLIKQLGAKIRGLARLRQYLLKLNKRILDKLY
jgi:hypothetical protein